MPSCGMIYSNTDGRVRGRRELDRSRLKFFQTLKRESREAATVAAKKAVLERLKRQTLREVTAG